MAAILRYIQPKLHALSNGLFANWLPDTLISVGDYGVLRDCGFERLGSLKDYGAQINTEPTRRGNNELEFKDRIDLSANTIGEADIPAVAVGNVSLTIRGKGAFLYHLFDVHQIRPVDQRDFEAEVAKVLVGTNLHLPDGAVLVTEVQHAAKATIIASDHAHGKLELATGFSPKGSAFLSGAKGNVSISSSAGSIFSWIAKNDTVTLLRLVRPRVPPPGGSTGDATAGGLHAALRWAQSIFKARELQVSELVIRPLPQSSNGLIVALGEDEFRLVLSDLSIDELMMSAMNELTTEVDDEPLEIEVPAQSFGQRYMSG